MTDKLSQTEEEAALERIVRNQLKIAELNAENDTLKGFFKGNSAYPAGTKKEVGKFYIKVTTNTRVDDGLARINLDSRTYNRLTKKVIDGTLAKKSLGSDAYAKIVKTYDNRIEIGLN
jgi:chaperone required for assembly of F1-ATPase